MIAAILPLLPAAPARDLALRIEAPRAATVGQTFTFRVWLVNERRETVTIADPTPLTYWLGTEFHDALSRSGTRVAPETGGREVGGRWSGQWVVSHRIGKEAFRTLRPGARLLIEERTFGREYVSGVEPSLGEMRDAPRRPLPEGAYVYRAEWTSRPIPEPRADRWADLGFALELSPEARTLAAKRWTGSRTVEHRFSIAPL